MKTQKFYRYKAVRYSVIIDADRELYGTSKPKLECIEYFVNYETPKGYWIGYFPKSKDHWVSKTSRKKFAYPTKEEALLGYYYKKLSYIKHCKGNLRKAEEDMNLINSITDIKLPLDKHIL